MTNLEKSERTNLADQQIQYEILLKDIRKIVYSDNELKDTLQRITSMLYENMHYTWIGFYAVKDNELLAETFQGPVMNRKICTAQGACGLAFTKECTVIIDEVEQFPKYIPTDDFERSEIAIPAFKKGDVALILNVGSNQVKYFNETDRLNLQQLMHLLEEAL